METFSSVLSLCEGNPPVTDGFPSQRPMTWNFDVFFDMLLNKWFSKQSRRMCLRRHIANYNVTVNEFCTMMHTRPHSYKMLINHLDFCWHGACFLIATFGSTFAVLFHLVNSLQLPPMNKWVIIVENNGLVLVVYQNTIESNTDLPLGRN